MPRFLPLLVALLVTLPGLAAAQGSDTGGSEQGNGAVTTSASAAEAVDALLRETAPAALARGNLSAARSAVDAAEARYNQSLLRDVNAGSRGLVAPALRDAFALARAAADANDSHRLAVAREMARGGVLAGAFYAFERYALDGSVAKARATLDLLGATYALRDHPAGRAWATAERMPPGQPSYLALVAEAVGRSPAHAGLFDLFVTDVLLDVTAAEMHLGNATGAGPDPARAAREAARARYAALVVLPEMQARSGAASAEALAMALADLTLGTEQGMPAPEPAARARDALRGFLGNASYVGASIDIVQAAYGAAVEPRDRAWAFTDLDAKAAARAHLAEALRAFRAAMGGRPEGASLQRRLAEAYSTLDSAADPLQVGYLLEGIRRDAVSALSAPATGDHGHEHGHGHEEPVSFFPRRISAKGVERFTLPLILVGLPTSKGAFSGGAFTLLVSYDPAQLRYESAEGAWAPLSVSPGDAPGTLRVTGATTRDAAREQPVANLTFSVIDPANRTRFTPINVTAESLVGGNGNPAELKPGVFMVDFDEAPFASPSPTPAAKAAAPATPGLGLALVALAVVGVALVVGRRRA